jgi:hypothetical protein
MQTKSMRLHLAIYAVSAALVTTPVQAEESGHDQTRGGFDALSREMSTCAAYFSLLSSIIENAEGPAAKVETAQRIKSIGQTLLTQSINVANLIGVTDNTVMERVQAALKEMVNAVNADPPNSLATMYTKYGRPCDDLLQNASRRFADLIARDEQEFGAGERYCTYCSLVVILASLTVAYVEE